jgi:predicted GH43/DUF377 family glycosyl hydrolase
MMKDRRLALPRSKWLAAAVAAVAVTLPSAGFASATSSASAAANPAVGARPGATVSADGLPDWAVGPFTRYPGNPLLSPEGTGFESQQVFNPGVVVVDGTFHMLYRGARAGDYSEIGAATSKDGYHFTRYAGNPAIPNSLPNEAHGVEDPRLYYLNGRYYSFFTGYSGTNIDINEAVSTDALHWRQLGPVLSNDKDAAVVTGPNDRPVKIDGHYVMYYGQSGNGVYLATSPDMIHWTTTGPIDLDFPSSYEPYELCVAVTDYPTVHGKGVNHGILLFVAGTLMAQGRWYYAISEVHFSGTDLTKETGQLSQPVLAPTTPYEINGITPEAVFMNTIMFYKGQWWMYYGAGDTVIALATAPLRSPGSDDAR